MHSACRINARPRPPKGKRWNNYPLKKWRQPRSDHRYDWHPDRVRPAEANFRVQPLAKDRVGEPADSSDDRYPPEARMGPTTVADQKESDHQRRSRDQKIASGAMHGSEDNPPPRSFVPQRIERQLDELPNQVPCKDNAE